MKTLGVRTPFSRTVRPGIVDLPGGTLWCFAVPLLAVAKMVLGANYLRVTSEPSPWRRGSICQYRLLLSIAARGDILRRNASSEAGARVRAHPAPNKWVDLRVPTRDNQIEREREQDDYAAAVFHPTLEFV